MKKRNKIIIALLIILIITGITLLCINLFSKKEKNDEVKSEPSSEKIEYYKNMHKRMYDYYKIKYKNINVPEDKKDSIIRINLGTLKRDGFPMDEFVSYDGKHECDLSKSYATRKVVNNKYVIEVFYKCGKDANYDYTKEKEKTTNVNSTTKKNSVTKEELESNRTSSTTTKVGE